MLAHVVKFHYKDPAAKWVLNAKRFHMSTGGRQTPLKFLLEPTKASIFYSTDLQDAEEVGDNLSEQGVRSNVHMDGWLLCSSCEKASFDRIANLRVHWACCVNVCGRYRKDLREGRSVLESPSTVGKLPKRRGKHEAIKCPLPTCVSAWRPSFKYPNAVTQIAHMISHHATDKEAYDIALKLGALNAIVGFILLTSWNSMRSGIIQRKSITLERQVSDLDAANDCKRLKSGVTDNVLRLLHVMICHLPDEDAVTWVKNWMKKRRHESVMETEPVFKFDVQESLNASVESGQCQIMCTFCSSLVEGHKYFAHRRRGSVCYDHNDTMSTKAESSIEKSKERPGRKRRFGMLEPGRIPGSSKIRKNPCTVCK
ncbi:hypothetical protein OSTOST_08652 [Ostertagia ostertagi]